MPEWKDEIRRRLSGFGLDSHRESEIILELAQHLEDRFSELVAGGTAPADAHRLVLEEIRDHDLMARELRRLQPPQSDAPPLGAAGRGRPMADVWQDVRYAFRLMGAKPGFTLVVVLTLALGVGANSALFSVINTVILRPLPFTQPERLVRLNETNPDGSVWSVSHPNFLDWKDGNRSFDHMAATGFASFNLTSAGSAERLPVSQVSADFLSVLEVNPALGRNFTPEEDRPGGNTRVVLITHGFWQRHFGGDSAVLGKTLVLNENPYTVTGVLPSTFRWGSARPELFVPLAADPARDRSDHRLQVIARMKPGVTIEQARSDMSGIAERIGREFPQSNQRWNIDIAGFYDWFVPEAFRRSLFVLLAAAGFVLLIACSNVANLQLGRGAARRKEISVRLALGASRSRLIRQLLVESLLLAGIAAALGTLLAFGLIQALKALAPGNLPRLDELSLDTRVFLFSAALALVTGILFGLIPAIDASRPDLNDTLKEGKRTGSVGGKHRTRTALVITEVALSVALLIGAGLLIRSFWVLQQIHPGYDPANLLTMQFTLPQPRYSAPAQTIGFYDRLLHETTRLPGIRSAALASIFPMGGGNTVSGLRIAGRGEQPGDRPVSDWRIVSPGYFRTLGMSLRGRDFDERDTAGTSVVIVSEEFVRKFWSGQDPIGKTFVAFSFGQGLQTVIGVASDVRVTGLEGNLRPMIYVSSSAAPGWNPMWLAVRTEQESSSAVASIRDVVKGIDANVPLFGIQKADQLLNASLGPRRFNMFLLGCFAALALTLAGIGLFGVLAYQVSQRTHEIAVRLALGAQPMALFYDVMGQGMVLAGVGSLVGLTGAYWLAQFLETLLFDVKPTDLFTFALVPLVLLLIALLACAIPARRATRVDPLVALRCD